MRVGVVGAGVVGSYFGGRLAHAGQNVVFLARGAKLQALREHGLQVDSVDGAFNVRPAQATDEPKSVGPVDVVLLAVKGWQVPGVIETMRPLMGASAFAVTLSDGIEVPDQVAAAFGTNRVVDGIALMLGTSVAPAHIRNTLPRTSIALGELDSSHSERLNRLQQAFEHAGVAARISPDIISSRWEKLMLVGPWSAISAVTRAPLGVVRSLSETRHLLEGTIREVLAVARARGAMLSEDAVADSLVWLDTGPATSVGNILRDLISGHPSELETEVGAIVRLALAAGVEVPRLNFLYTSLLPLERRGRGELKFTVCW
jgi:2-dehydropantoate 2-reductase